MWRSLARHVLLIRSEGASSRPPGGDPLKSKLHDLEKFHLLEEETHMKQSRTKRRPTRYCVYYCMLLDTVRMYCTRNI